MTRFPFRIWVAYAGLALVFFSLNFLGSGKDSGGNWPRLKLMDKPDGLLQFDNGETTRSMSRLGGVKLGRELGNSLRIAAGQRVEWITWGGKDPEMLFPKIDLWVSRGMDENVRKELDSAAESIANYDQMLKKRGWTLVVLPIPTKLAVHRDLAHFPVMEDDLISRRPVQEDRSDEVYGHLISELARHGVPAVNLLATYRASLNLDPKQLLYMTNDSHWSGRGIELAAGATAKRIESITSLKSREPVNPTYLNVDEVGDLAKAFDPLPSFVSWLRPVWIFHDSLMNGEAGKGYPYSTNPKGLVVCVGTSYTGQYTWIENQPVGFAWQLALHLDNVDFQNRPAAGQGSFHSFGQFLNDIDAVEKDFANKKVESAPRVVVWEFPIRDVQDIPMSSR